MWESYIDGFSRLRRENPSESLYGGTSQRRGEKCLAAPVEIWYAGSKGVDPVYLFDLDGTITDTNNLWLEVDREFLACRGLSPTPEYTDVVSRSIYPIAAQFTRDHYHLSDAPEDIMAEWDALALHHYRDLAPLKPGAADFLRQCREEGIPMAVFTACRPALCRAALERFGLADYFTAVVYAEEIGLEKRDPACFVELGRRLGADLADCTLFDDSPDNCATAAKAGLDTVGVYDSYYAHRQEELRAVCRRYVRSLEELVT